MTQRSDLADLPVADLGAGFRSGRFTPVDALEAAFARMDRFDPMVNAFVFEDRATSRAMAEASALRFARQEAVGPLDGIPTSVKDLSPVAGWPNRRGSPALDPKAPAPEDAPPVARLREAGAVFIGKTATPESGSRIVARSAIHGVTRNPYRLDLTPGGSSGGAAAALAVGMGTLATGTDGAGSIRIPAAFCNLTGLKPGFGRIPSFPPSLFMPHSVTGPMARCLDDLLAMTTAMTGHDQRDPFAWPLGFGEASAKVPATGLKVALSYDTGTGVQPEPAIIGALDQVAAALQSAGVVVETASPDWSVPPSQPFDVFWKTSYAGFLDMYPVEQANLMSPLLHEIAEAGRAIDILAYHRAINERLALTATAQHFLTDYDAILCPSVIGPAFDVEREAPAGAVPDDWAWCPYAYIFNMTGQPALAVPTGLDAAGLPLGVQMAARAGGEETLFRLGRVVEAALTPAVHRPRLLTDALGETPS